MQSGDDLVIAAIVHRRRLAYQAAKKRQKSGPQGKKRRPRSFFSWRDHLHRLSPRDFKLRYRLDLESFGHLHSLIVSRIETKNKNQVGAILFIDVSPQSDELVLINMIPPHQARRSRKGGAVSSRVRLAAGLRYLAGGQVTDLACCYHISKREVYSSLWLVVDAINDHPDFDISFPIDDTEQLKEIELEFALAHQRRYGTVSWRGQVGAIDGIDIKQKNPGKAVDNPARFYVQRKAGYMLLCIAICDSRRRFTYYSIGTTATSHDSLAWDATKLGQRVSTGDLKRPFFLNGDNAFTSTNSMVTPMNDSDFDFYQSSNRMAIECAFGMLVRRWGVFWRPLEVAFDRRTPLVGAAMRLHNYCIDRRIAIELEQVAGASLIQPRVWMPTPEFDSEGRPVDFLDTFDHAAAPFGANSTREALKKCLSGNLLKRPREDSYTRAKRARGVP